MHLVFKLGLLFVLLVITKSESTEEVLKCNLRYCGAELLHFDNFNLGMLFRKMEIANFCIKNCTPVVVHEFFQSIIFSITKRIPGHCVAEECVDKNRFIALARCLESEAWELLQCGKTLIDLAHIGLVPNPADEKRNTTCRIVTDSVQCIEDTLQKCGDKPFLLVKEILGDLIKIGINAYCHADYRHEGLFVRRTTLNPNDTVTESYTGPTLRHPQFVKGYRSNDVLSTVSHSCLFFSVLFSVYLSIRSSQ